MPSLLATEELTAVTYLQGTAIKPLFLCGDAMDVLQTMPANSVDCVMTSPPYWSQRAYSGGGIGLEDDYEDYVTNLVAICGELQRILKPTGSFWLNIGDAYLRKNLLGIPWRVAFRLTDEQGSVFQRLDPLGRPSPGDIRRSLQRRPTRHSTTLRQRTTPPHVPPRVPQHGDPCRFLGSRHRSA